MKLRMLPPFKSLHTKRFSQNFGHDLTYTARTVHGPALQAAHFKDESVI